MKLNFDEWLERELSKPVSAHFDYNGNSPRAILLRGKRKEFIWHSKRVIPKFISETKYFWDGFDTPISWFILTALAPLYIPISFFTFPFFSYKRAMKEYKQAYKEYVKDLKND